MSIHSSLRTAGATKKHRSVLKRFERLTVLKEKGLWDESKSSLGLLKVKQQKLKVKKEKVAKAETPGAEGAPAAQAGAEKAAAPQAKSDKK